MGAWRLDGPFTEQKASQSYLNDYPKVIDSNGRLAHGGTGEIKFVSAASPVPQLAVKLAGGGPTSKSRGLAAAPSRNPPA